MPRQPFIYPNLLGGQNDTRIEEGTEVPRWVNVRNARLRDGSLSRRPGMKRIAVCGTDATSLDLVAASSHYVKFPPAAQLSMKAPYTIEFLIEPDAYAGTQVVAGFASGGTWPFEVFLDGDAIKITLKDSGGSDTITAHTTSGTTGERFAVQLAVAVGGAYTTRVHDLLTDGSYNTTTATGTLTIGDTLLGTAHGFYLGRNNGGNYFDGHIDYFRIYRYVAPDFSMAWRRWPTPQQTYMVCDYGGEVDANDWVLDRSLYGNHGEIQNAATTGAALAINAAPVQAIKQFLDKSLTQRLLLVAGGRVHSVEL